MKKIVCIALAACFVVALFSFSSSAAVVITSISPDFVALVAPGWVSYPFTYSNGVYDFNTYLENVPTDSPYFYFLTFHYNNLNYDVPEIDGRGVSLSFEISLDIDEFGYLSSDPTDIVNSAIFTSFNANVYFSDGSSVTLGRSAFSLFDTDSGQVVDPYDVSFWMSHINSPFSLKLAGTLNLSAYMGKEISSIRIYFPNGSGISRIYYRDASNYIAISNLDTKISFVYTPTLDIIDNGFSTINNRLNIIDEDINRIDQSFSDLNDTIEDFQNDLTSSDSSISSDISDKEDVINSIKDAMENDNSFLDNALNDMIIGFPDAEDPFHDAPSPDGFFAVDFIQQLWSFIKAQTVFFDFIFLGLCFCLATFILRR